MRQSYSVNNVKGEVSLTQTLSSVTSPFWIKPICTNRICKYFRRRNVLIHLYEGTPVPFYFHKRLQRLDTCGLRNILAALTIASATWRPLIETYLAELRKEVKKVHSKEQEQPILEV